MSDSSAGGGGSVWPDDLEIDDRLTFDGDEYVVVGTGSGEATAVRVDDDRFKIEIFRWAFTDSVGIEMEVTMEQDAFGRCVKTDT